MTDRELIHQLNTAIALMTTVATELENRKTSLLATAEKSTKKLAKAPTKLNDPLEFYVSQLQKKEGSELRAGDMFSAYKEWCHSQGSYTRGYRPFLDTIAQIQRFPLL